MRRTFKTGGRSFLSDTRGNVALVFGVAAPLLLAATGGAIDYSVAASQQLTLQHAADAAAIAAARELAFAGRYSDRVNEVAKAVARANLSADGHGAEIVPSPTADLNGVTVEISQQTTAYFSGLLRAAPNEVFATATATTLGEKICVIALGDTMAKAIDLNRRSKVTAVDCTVYSNSTQRMSIDARDTSRLVAKSICTAGGYGGTLANYSPEPLTDCPPLSDPLASRPEPTVGACTARNLRIRDEKTTLSPGTYCGGLSIGGSARVALLPGIYVIRDGMLRVDGTATLRGEHVGFYFSGLQSFFAFDREATVDLWAPKQGPMAGILFWQNRRAPTVLSFTISSNYTRTLVGTIYLPRGRLVVDADSPVADRSAYTAIVALGMDLDAGPELVINSDYSGTDVPVPFGVGPTGATRLSQ